jgi:hypothetical protein
MKPITLKKALALYVDALLENNIAPQLYFRDGYNHYHSVDQFDIARDRLQSDDGWWEYYEYILQYEGGRDHLLFVKESQDEC